MKICVYSMAKNEKQFCKRWAEKTVDADYRVVLDTGSTDGTPDILKNMGVDVDIQNFISWKTLEEYDSLAKNNLNPWRWDTARNASMRLIPDDTDICVRVDMDEYFSDGWRNAIESAWKPNSTRGMYKYVWSFNSDGSEGTSFFVSNITKYGDYEYIHANHEIPNYIGSGNEVQTYIPDCTLFHTPVWKASRGTNLPLLILAAREEPENARNIHYLGREYMYACKYDQAIKILKHHLDMPSSTWPAERAASMRYLANCYEKLGIDDSAEIWYTRAASEAPQFREGFYGLEKMMYRLKNWRRCIYYGRLAVNIKDRDLSYITEAEAWGSAPWDILSIALYNTGDKSSALNCALTALKYSPYDDRIRNNIKLMS